MDMFKEFPDELINSVGWILTKCPADITEESVAKRIQNLQNVVKAEKAGFGPLIDQLFERLARCIFQFFF